MNLLLLIFILGLFVGSFLNVLIDRLPRDESILRGRSYCESCKKKLAWYDLIPVFSFILLKRECRYCGALLSWYYPLVEVITGGFFVLTFLFLQQSNLPFTIYHLPFLLTLFYYLIIMSSLIVIFFTDLKYGIIPDKVVYPAIVITLLFFVFTSEESSEVGSRVLSAGAAFAFFFLLYTLTRGKGMGFGDVKFAILMGLFLGFPKIVVALYAAFLTGALFSFILIVWGKKKLGSAIPFGPFLVLGTLAGMFGGDFIAQNLLPFLVH